MSVQIPQVTLMLLLLLVMVEREATRNDNCVEMVSMVV